MSIVATDTPRAGARHSAGRFIEPSSNAARTIAAFERAVRIGYFAAMGEADAGDDDQG